MITSTGYAPAINASAFNVLIQNSLNNQLDKQELFLYNALSSYFTTAFNAAKKNKLQVAFYHLDQGNLLLNGVESSAYYKWSALFALPKKAYCLYKSGDITAAEMMTQDIITLCGVLRESGYEYVIFAQLQQYQNLARLYFFSGRIDQAIELCNQCLQLLYCGSSGLTTSKYLSGDTDPLKDELAIAFFYQLFVETLYIFLRIAKGKKEMIAQWVELFLTPHLMSMMENKKSNTEYQQMLEIMHVLQLLSKSNWNDFTDKLANYLSLNPISNERMKTVLLGYINYPG